MLLEGLIKKLKDYNSCNEDLAILIRQNILEPFQLNLTQPSSIRKPPPTPTDFKKMAVRLAPQAMTIVNQNIKSLGNIKKVNLSSNIYTVAINCLIDTTFYALSALRHMSGFTLLEPLEIDKSTSNLICKMVELGEYDRSLDEIRKIRTKLASYAKVQLKSQSDQKSNLFIKNALTESNVNATQITQWEDDMINKYQDLFQFPFDPNLTSETVILLILAYQMNTIRSWCELKNGALAKFLPFFFSKPGNFFDWCLHLFKFNKSIAQQQLNAIQRLLYIVANKFPVTEDAAYHSYNIQFLALKALKLSGSTDLKLVLDRVVRIGVTYEKATKQTMYTHIQTCCSEFLQDLEPNLKDLEEMDAYFILCEYYAYISKKAKSYKGAFYAYKYMIKSVRHILENPTLHTFYYTAYAANAKLALGSVQMDKMVLDTTFADISTTLTEAVSLLKFVKKMLDKKTAQDEHSQQALYNLNKSVNAFKQSSKRLYDYIMEKTQQELMASRNDPCKTPPSQGELITPSDYGQWNSIVSYLRDALVECSDILPAALYLISNKSTQAKRVTHSSDLMSLYVEIMVLLARMEFNMNDKSSHQPAYEYLAAAEQMCTEKKFSSGYRWLSGSYYYLGSALIKIEAYKEATYPIRKSCTLLEKDTERSNQEEGRIQLCKRYEILGLCYYKKKDFEDSTKAYQLALKRLPVSFIEKFVSKADTIAISSIMEQEPLLPKLIDRFLRTSVVDPDQSGIQFASEFIQLSTLKPIQQCVIYECELKIWNALSLKMDLTKFQSFIIDKLLKYYDEENYPIRRARVLLSQVQVERTKTNRKHEHCLQAAMACAKQVLHLLKVEHYKQDISLLNYRLHYLASANSWIAICSRELGQQAPDTFTTTLQQWGTLLKKITPIYNSKTSSQSDIQHVYNSIDDVNQFYNHMRMLADLFAVTGEYIHQICALRILLKLNNMPREGDCITDSIVLSSAIARVYCDLGYTGKASMELNKVQHMISNQSCSNMAQLVYRVSYSYYLACIGDFDTSKETLDATKVIWENTPFSDAKDTLMTVKSYTRRCILLSDIYFTLSKIQVNTDTLDRAIENATCSLQLLNKCIKVLQTAQQEKEPSKELENPFMPSPPPEPKKVVFRESQWLIAHKTSQCLLYLAHLCMQKGSWNEAIYFVKQGPLLAEKVNSGFMFFNSAICACEYYIRCGELSKAQDQFEKASEYQPTGNYHYLDEAKLKSLMAHVALANNYHDIAISTYTEANDMLEKLSRPEYISNLEALIHGEINMEEMDSFDCIPLQQLQSTNIIQKAKSAAQKGLVQDALDILDRLDESGLAIENIIESTALASQWRLSAIQKELLPNQKVAVLPAVKLQVARGNLIKRNTVHKNSHITQDNLANTMERMLEAYQFGFNKERTFVISNLCHQLGYSMFLKEIIASTQSRILVNNHALLSAYYLSMSNGINMRREMQNCLKIKTSQSFPGHAPSDTAWPAMNREELQERYGRFARMNQHPKWLQSHLNTLSDLYRVEQELDDKEFQDKYVDIIPENWTVCSLSLDPISQDLYAIQLRANETPFIAKLPMRRHQEQTISFQEAQAELKDIIDKSDETIHMSKSCVDPIQIKSWWDKRIELDTRLKTLLDNMENQWLSGFKGIMSGRCYEFKEELVKFQKNLNEAVYKFVNQIATVKKAVEFGLNFCRLLFRLGRYPSVCELEDLSLYSVSCYETQGVEIDYTKLDIKPLVDQIRTFINRYHEKCSMAGVLSSKTIPNDHVILILDKHLQAFPLESMPLLRSQSVSRLPCLSFLRDRILYTQSYNTSDAFDDFGIIGSKEWKDLTVSKTSAFYVLNPGGDLQDTQKEFEPIFKSIPQWNGVMETMPMEFQCKDALQTKDIYMYFGHSAGQAFMRGTTVRQLPTCAVSLLMGCSSGIMTSTGEFDPYGYVLNYLLAGSPAVVANLWDVTDKSIDRLTKYMLNSWGLLKKKQTSKSLVQAVTEARNVCKLPYLIGAAPVVYGIPVYIDEDKS